MVCIWQYYMMYIFPEAKLKFVQVNFAIIYRAIRYSKKLFGSGLQIVSPTSVSVLRAMEIILAYLCQILVMGQYPNAICIGGAVLVMGSVLGIAIDEKLNNHSS